MKRLAPCLFVVLAACTSASDATPSPRPVADSCSLRADIPDPYSDVWWTRAELVPLIDGLPAFTIDGVRHDHPVALAQWGLHFDFEGALPEMMRIADELIAISVVEGDARLYAYSFPYNYSSQPLEPPWYSGMAQGQVLSVMVRLAEATGREDYARFARESYQGLLTMVDEGEGFWIEEYPVPDSNPVLNGHGLAALGIWDYWRWSGDGEEALCRAIETLAGHIEEDADRAAYYDRDMHLPLDATHEYRVIHQFVFQALADISGSKVLADAAVSMAR